MKFGALLELIGWNETIAVHVETKEGSEFWCGAATDFPWRHRAWTDMDVTSVTSYFNKDAETSTISVRIGVKENAEW